VKSFNLNFNLKKAKALVMGSEFGEDDVSPVMLNKGEIKRILL